VSRSELPEKLTPLAAGLGLRPYYGDIHNHCNLSYGHGSLEDALARAQGQLDFVSVTGHAHWPDMPVDDESVAHIVAFHVEGFERLRRLWPDHFDTLARFDAPGRFTVFPGYEIHSSEYGDYTVVYRDLEPRDLLIADSPAELKQLIDRDMPGKAFGFPHHIGYRHGARGINWGAFDPALSPFVEMFSMHGCAETSDTDLPYLHSMGPLNGRSTMEHGLHEGHVFGVVGNSDHHSAYPGSYGHGRMGVYAPNASRDALWDGMMARRTLALTGDRIHLLGAIEAHVGGDVIAPQEGAVLDIEAVAGGAIDSIDVVRNGTLFHRVTPALEPRPIASDEETLDSLLVVEFGWGARRSSHRWRGDLTVYNGEITGCEQRFRGSEVVSPTEGEGDSRAPNSAECSDNHLEFDVLADANPNNRTPTTQAVAMRVRLGRDARISLRVGNYHIDVPAERLQAGALSDNLGPIDSPAFRLHRLPAPQEWQWQGKVDLGRLEAGESVYLRLRQSNGQRAWSSPIFCRS